jgi:hypothetical protein
MAFEVWAQGGMSDRCSQRSVAKRGVYRHVGRRATTALIEKTLGTLQMAAQALWRVGLLGMNPKGRQAQASGGTPSFFLNQLRVLGTP